MLHTFETNECLEFNTVSAAVGWDTDYRQVGAGAFEGWLDMRLCSELRLTDQYCSRATVVDGVPPENELAILLTVNPGDKGCFLGREYGDGEVAIMSPGLQGTARTPADFRMMTVSIPLPRLRSAFAEVTGQELTARLHATRMVRLPDGDKGRLAQTIMRGLRLAGPADTSADLALALHELEEYLAAAVSLGLQGTGESPGARARRNRGRYVARAREYIHAHLTRPLGLETLTRATGVSVRTVEYAFRDVLGVTPMRYVKACRLAAARQRLLDPHEPGLSVTRVATDLGFSHLSYFARDYRAMFGETPGETVARTNAALPGGSAR